MSGAMLQVDRRTAIRWAAALAAALGSGAHAVAAPVEPIKGYGTDPKLIDAKAPWPRILTAAQLRTVAAMCDHVLPAEGDAPAASAIGIHELIDEWVSAPYPVQQADRTLILEGLDLLGPGFATAGLSGREQALAALAAKGKAGFYARMRALTIGAYYTTEAGFKDIGYIGNQALDAFPPMSAEVKAHIDRASAKLGLPVPS